MRSVLSNPEPDLLDKIPWFLSGPLHGIYLCLSSENIRLRCRLPFRSLYDLPEDKKPKEEGEPDI